MNELMCKYCIINELWAHIQKGSCSEMDKASRELWSKAEENERTSVSVPPIFLSVFFLILLCLLTIVFFFFSLFDWSIFIFHFFQFCKAIEGKYIWLPQENIFSIMFYYFLLRSIIFPRFRLFLCICHNLVFFILVLNHHLLYLCTIF